MTHSRVGLFLDRDGTINTEVDFLSRPEELHLIPRAAEAIREANSFGVKVFVVTNQSGIARGLLTETDLRRIHRRLTELLHQAGARIDDIYYCPHHPEFGTARYRISCSCRKPKTGMLDRAAREHGIDLGSSFVIGDRCIDMMAGVSAGCRTVLVLTGYGAIEHEECLTRTRVDYVSSNLYEAWRYVRRTLRTRERAVPKH